MLDNDEKMLHALPEAWTGGPQDYSSPVLPHGIQLHAILANLKRGKGVFMVRGDPTPHAATQASRYQRAFSKMQQSLAYQIIPQDRYSFQSVCISHGKVAKLGKTLTMELQLCARERELAPVRHWRKTFLSASVRTSCTFIGADKRARHQELKNRESLVRSMRRENGVH